MPQPEACGNRDDSKQIQQADGRPVLDQVSCVTDSISSADCQVCAIGNQAEARKELQPELNSHLLPPRQTPDEQWDYRSKCRARPADDQRQRIDRQVGPRNGQRMQDHRLDSAAGCPSSDDVPQFVNGLHHQPTIRESAYDVERLGRASFA